MCSEKDGNNVPTPSSSPADSAPEQEPARPNAFDSAFLARLMDRDEPPAAEEADWAGPWRIDHLPDGDLAFYRQGESAARGYQPVARFHNRWDALLTMAIIACRREAAYRVRELPDGKGYAVQSRPAWGETVGWLAVFDDKLIEGLSFLEALMRSPEAVSFFLEACGKVVLERAGAILEERVETTSR